MSLAELTGIGFLKNEKTSEKGFFILLSNANICEHYISCGSKRLLKCTFTIKNLKNE
jgi:hypothetical protein